MPEILTKKDRQLLESVEMLRTWMSVNGDAHWDRLRAAMGVVCAAALSCRLALTNRQHGVDCPKINHAGGGYLHDADDDTPYDVDGVFYCGRCHGWIG